ncbi:MAG: methylenetetrahydrofolate reductase [NAD(P)H] [Rhodospirillales bacterium]|nr:methylenetetrahydrofolate reductase [NAD(P)H] [Rhodospirillales bacterium]
MTPDNSNNPLLNVTARGRPAALDLAIATPLPQDVNVSFEFFPPTVGNGAGPFWASVERLLPLNPSFVSVTYGAGGTAHNRTLDVVKSLARATKTDVAMHLTCAGASRDEVNKTAQEFADSGGRHIVALRGDPPKGANRYEPHSQGYAYATDLVAGLRDISDFDISVAAYPETHPEAGSAEFDLDNLKRKLDAGATRAISQFFFNVEDYLRFLERVRKAGIAAPVIPGILPVVEFQRIARFAERCGAKVPDWMGQLFEGLDHDPATRRLVAASVAAEQCRALYAQGVDTFHFYTLNQADLCFAVCHMLGVRPSSPARIAA